MGLHAFCAISPRAQGRLRSFYDILVANAATQAVCHLFVAHGGDTENALSQPALHMLPIPGSRTDLPCQAPERFAPHATLHVWCTSCGCTPLGPQTVTGLLLVCKVRQSQADYTLRALFKWYS